MKLTTNLSRLHSVASLVSDQQFPFSIAHVRTEIDPIEIKLKKGGIDIGSFDEIDWEPVASYQGHQILFYIPDQGWRIDEVVENPSQGKKFHMSWCKTLDSMKRNGRIERYKATSNLSGRFDVFGLSERESGEVRTKVELKVCKNCLSNINYKQYESNRHEVFQNFSIPEFFEHYSSYFEHKPNKAIDPGRGYTEDWTEVSAKVRARCGWTCQDCNVDLNEERDLLHTHHINGVKSDNRANNLRVLCAECHFQQPNHSHLKVSSNELARIRARRAS